MESYGRMRPSYAELLMWIEKMAEKLCGQDEHRLEAEEWRQSAEKLRAKRASIGQFPCANFSNSTTTDRSHLRWKNLMIGDPA